MHAHIHIMPFEKLIADYLPDECKLREIVGFEDLKTEINNYLFLKDINGYYYIVENNNYPPQFFRRIACKALGMEEYWDWREHPFLKNMEKTIDFYNDI